MFRHIVPQQAVQPPLVLEGTGDSEEEVDEAITFDANKV